MARVGSLCRLRTVIARRAPRERTSVHGSDPGQARKVQDPRAHHRTRQSADGHRVRRQARRPVITDRLDPLPIEQEWIIDQPEAGQDTPPGSPYVIHLAYPPGRGHRRARGQGLRQQRAAFRMGAVHLRAGHRRRQDPVGQGARPARRAPCAQIELVALKPEFQETWTLEYVGPSETTE